MAALALCRPVPVFAEASVIAGMRMGPALAATSPANLGLSAVYAGVGAAAKDPWGFLLAFAAALVMPGLALLITRRLRPVRS
jgi:Na+/proline symporter